MRNPNDGAEFGVAARQRQASFRTSQTISLQGRSPTDPSGQRNQYLLALGCEEENLYPGIRGYGGAVDFFAERDIRWHSGGRSADNGSSVGPTRNMASSQVACVNFLLPLASIPGALTAALRSIDGDVRAIVPIEHRGNTSPVEFEWIGFDRSLEGNTTRGAVSTSVDAFVVAETQGERRRAYLLEWKYVEEYLSTQPDFLGEGTAGDTRRGRYGNLYPAPTSSFNPDTAPELDDFLYEPFYQIMRQRLLADRMVRERELNLDEAKVVVIVPEENLAYRRVSDGSKTTSPPLVQRFPHLEMVEEVMRASLKDPDTQFEMVAPYIMVDAVVAACPSGAASWAAYWRQRYGV